VVALSCFSTFAILVVDGKLTRRAPTVKSFTSKTDAEAYVAGKEVAAPADEPAKFYAVAVGNPTGIFTDWAEAALSIKGVKGPKYKRFGTRAEAVDYIRQFGNREAVEALGEVARVAEKPAKSTKSAKAVEAAAQSSLGVDVIKIYTDGSSLANGKQGSRAGIGVFFGDGDARNISERLVGEPQTNQRAELMAMLRALQTVPDDQKVQIFSDSQYSINCVTQWAMGWKKKDWRTATGEEVKNQDIIRAILNKMDERKKAKGDTFYHWVKGHSADRGNAAADRLAVRGAKLLL
jgi:ribonuclease HI